jgi:hypothetical protein
MFLRLSCRRHEFPLIGRRHGQHCIGSYVIALLEYWEFGVRLSQIKRMRSEMKKPSGIYAGGFSSRCRPGAGSPRRWFGKRKLSREAVNFDQLGRVPVHARTVHRFFLTGEGKP